MKTLTLEQLISGYPRFTYSEELRPGLYLSVNRWFNGGRIEVISSNGEGNEERREYSNKTHLTPRQALDAIKGVK